MTVQDHATPEIPFEYRVIGPPGTGKTTWLAEQVTADAEEGRHVLVTSLTKAAAAEIDRKDILYPDQLGTLHSHAFMALGNPKLAHGKTSIEAWNEEYPEIRLTEAQNTNGASLDKDNTAPTHSSLGNSLLAAYQWYRARKRPFEAMPDDIKGFATRWERFKKDMGTMDFTDLIQRAIEETDAAPGSPDVIYADESQDFDFMEMQLLRRWGMAAGRLIAVGDPDQNLYAFRGSDPRAFTTPELPPEQWHTLDQSYRVPRAVHRQALKWVNQQTNRHPVNYNPRDAIGEVRHSGAIWSHPESLIPEILEYIEQNKTIMLIASASYMIDPLVVELRRNAIPFHNPQRLANGTWNPIPSRKNATNAAQRLHAFLKMSNGQPWSADDIRMWTAQLKISGIIQGRNAQERINGLEDDDTDYDGKAALSTDKLFELLTEEAIEAAYSGNIDWYEQHLTAQAAKSSTFSLDVARTWGPDALSATPKVTVGTCHSVKGGESDVVYLFPDLSTNGLAEWQNGEGRNAGAVYRLFYVGMTRARETLVICNPDDPRSTSPQL